MVRTKHQRTVPLLLVVIALLLVAARVAAHFFADAPKNQLVRWVPLENAGSLAASSNRILLIDFTADWCAPCHLLDAEVFSDPVLAKEINERFIPVRVIDRMREEGRNSPSVEALERRYSVRSFPTVLFVDADGTERARMEGYGGPEEFRRVMESIR
ncbi:MAG: thioredoxin family protein [Acidobacteriota bacterium]|nr:thioredoxin family protein [Acidobacteriota bacterium]